MFRRLLPLALFGLFAPSAAFAQQGQGQELQLPPPPKDEDATAAVRPYAPDERSGSFLVRARGSITSPVGRLASGFYFDHVVSGGPGVDGTLGIGVARYASLEITGGYAWFPQSSGCIGVCSGGSAWGGAALVYHPVQALAFDATLSFGMGWRGFWFDGISHVLVTRTFQGELFQAFEPAKVAIGGEFYPVPVLGIGPTIQADLGVVVDGPLFGSVGSIYTVLSAGLRLSLEPTRKPVRAPRPAPVKPGVARNFSLAEDPR